MLWWTPVVVAAQVARSPGDPIHTIKQVVVVKQNRSSDWDFGTVCACRRSCSAGARGAASSTARR